MSFCPVSLCPYSHFTRVVKDKMPILVNDITMVNTGVGRAYGSGEQNRMRISKLMGAVNKTG